LFHRARREREFAEELESHLALHIEDNLRAGMSPEEARRRALVKLGGVTLTKERYREQGGLPMLETLWQDLRFGLRMLQKHPSFSLIAILTLALGIGANTAIFSVVNAVLLRSLPYHEPDSLVMVRYYRSRLANDYALGAEFLEWRERAKSFAQIAAFRFDTADLTGHGEPERLSAGFASADLFSTLGVAPLLGRAFMPAEDTLSDASAVILSDGYWQRRFGGNRQVLGQTLRLGEQSRTIIGVLPPRFRLMDDADVWLPLALNVNQQLNRQGSAVRVNVLARLKPGATLESAKADLSVILDQQRQAFPQVYSRFGNVQVRVIELREHLVGNVRQALWVLFGAVLFVLLIACANVANLLLARSASRQRELAIRAAVGAGRWRLMRQLLTESLLLSLAGGIVGLLLAKWGVKLFVAFSPNWIARIEESRVDGRVLGFTCGAAVLTGLLAGILPAWQASKTDVNETLKAQSSRSVQGGAQRALPALMIAELALSLVLLVGAGLMMKSFARLLAVPKGFDPAGVLMLGLNPSGAKYPMGSPQRHAYFQSVLERVQALPGIQTAGLASLTPLEGGTTRSTLELEGRPPFAKGQEPMADANLISPEYFAAMSMPMRSGRAFTAQDGAGAPPVVIINETIARRFFPNEDPRGQRLMLGADSKTIVGVVGDSRHYGLDQEARLDVYLPYLQFPEWGRSMNLAVRADSAQNNPSSLVTAIRNQVLAIEPNEPVSQIMTLEERLANSRAITGRRFQMLLFGVFAAVALIIATIGIYGLISYAVSQRTPEIGIRMALGAQTSDVLRMVLWRGMRLALCGVALGLAAALALTRVMKTLLFNVSATDPATFGLIALLLLGVALLACWIPARRATKVDPLIALRHE